jgi:hypothetical protein
MRNMVPILVDSIERPLRDLPKAQVLAMVLLARAQTMGLLPPQTPEHVDLDWSFLRAIAGVLEDNGVAVGWSSSLRRLDPTSVEDTEVAEALRAMIDALNASPHPLGEWPPVREMLGDDLLVRLLGISTSSLRRYASGERDTPDETAWRLHIIARILGSLVGSYNEYGVRRWFERPRKALEGSSPSDVIIAARSEDDERLRDTLLLADELLGAASAT